MTTEVRALIDEARETAENEREALGDDAYVGGLLDRLADALEAGSVSPVTEPPKAQMPKRRLRSCVENWPDAETGEYNPSCCRFPKSCSATIYNPETINDEALEPALAVLGEPEGKTQ